MVAQTQAKTRTATPPPRAKTAVGQTAATKVQPGKKENITKNGVTVPEVKSKSRLATFKEKLPRFSRLVVAAIVVGFFVAVAVLIHNNVDTITAWFRNSWCKEAFEKLSTLVASEKVSEVLSTVSVYFGGVRSLLNRAIQTVAKLPVNDIFDTVVLFVWTHKIKFSAVSVCGLVTGFGVIKFVAQRRVKTA